MARIARGGRVSSNAGERDIARRMGFARPRPKLQFTPGPRSGQSASLLELLGVKRGQRAALVGVSGSHLSSPQSYSQVRSLGAAPSHPVDVIVYEVGSTFGLRRVRELASLVKKGGALWILWPQGAGHISQSHVQRSGLAAGMVDVALVGVSDELAALKFIHGRDQS
jgi:hypothetical protein